MSTNIIEVIIAVGKGATNIEATYKRSGREYVTSNGFVGEIVRCKDCKNKIENQGEAWICGHPSNNAWNITPEHFCSYGERSK